MADFIYQDPDFPEDRVPQQKLKSASMTSSNNSSTASSPQRIKDKTGKKKNSVLRKILLSSTKTDAKRGMAIRVGERRKRAKKVFDPSENNVPSKRKRGRPVGSLNKTTLKKQNCSSSSLSKNLKTYSQKSKSESVESSNEDETNDSQSFIMETNNKVTGGVCSVCRQYRSPKDNSEKLVGCRDCSNKAHPSCLHGDGMLRLRPDNTWQCPHCKTCVVCIETTDAGVLTVCNVCADPYHALCHVPPIPESLKAWNQWECKNCQETKTPGQNIDSNYIEKMPGSDRSSKMSDWSDSNRTLDRRRDKSNGKNGDNDERRNLKCSQNDREGSFSPVHRENPKWNYSRKLVSPENRGVYDWKSNDDTQDTKHENDKRSSKRNYSKCNANDEQSKNADKNSIFMNNHDLHKFYNNDLFRKHPNHNDDVSIDTSIPDAQHWTSDDVFQYFSTYFPEEAHVFKEQEIDGKSLLMMRRNDVLNNLKLPLGQALKIFRHVVKLQSRKDDITMCWF